MIWVDGKIVPDDGLTISVLDRTFEHGLGLFETLRTWGGRVPLLDRHKARMLRSAEALRIVIDPTRFPDHEAVRSLIEAEGSGGDRVLRITASGGSSPEGAVVWMRSRSLPPRLRTPEPAAIRVVLDTWTIRRDDPLARYKTLNYWSRRLAQESAQRRGFDETLGLSDEGTYIEAGWSNLFVVLGDDLITASLDAPIIPGVMRRLVLDLARETGLVVREPRGISADELIEAEEVFLTNSVHGIAPVARTEGPLEGQSWDRAAPGPRTRQLQALLAERLDRGTLP